LRRGRLIGKRHTKWREYLQLHSKRQKVGAASIILEAAEEADMAVR